MIDTLLALMATIGTGLLSAVFPPVNAETAAAVTAAVTNDSLAIAGGLGLALGQTFGKIVIYEGARAGRETTRRYMTRYARDPEAPPSRWARWGAKLVDMMKGRWNSAGVIFLSASVGLPPLLATAVTAGVLHMRRLDFVMAVFAGRAIRFLVIIIPIALTTG